MNAHQPVQQISFLLEGTVQGLQFNRFNTKQRNLLDFRPKVAGDLRITIEAEKTDDEAFNFQAPLKCKASQRFEATSDQVAFVNAIIGNKRMVRVPDWMRLPLTKRNRICIDSDGYFIDNFFPCRHECPRDIEEQINHAENVLLGHMSRFLELMRWRQNCDASSRLIEHYSLYWNTGQPDFRLAPLVGRRDDITIPCSLGFSHGTDDLIALEDLWMNESLTEPLGHALLREAADVRKDSIHSAWLIMTAGLEAAVKTTISNLAPDTDWLLEEVASPPVRKLFKDYLPEICKRRGRELGFWANLGGHFKKLEHIVKVRNKIAHTGRLPPDVIPLNEAMEVIEDLLYILDVVNGHEWAKCYVSYPLREKLGWPKPAHSRMTVTVIAND